MRVGPAVSVSWTRILLRSKLTGYAKLTNDEVLTLQAVYL